METPPLVKEKERTAEEEAPRAGGSDFRVAPIGRVRSEWLEPGQAPAQGAERETSSVIEIFEEFQDAAEGLELEETLIVLTWLHRSDRNIHRVHPRGDRRNPERGVFATRSPHRPNPIGHHVVRLVCARGRFLEVRGMDVIDGTPLLDIKPFREALDTPR